MVPKIADMALRIESARLLNYKAAALKDKGMFCFRFFHHVFNCHVLQKNQGYFCILVSKFFRRILNLENCFYVCTLVLRFNARKVINNIKWPYSHGIDKLLINVSKVITKLTLNTYLLWITLLFFQCSKEISEW